jgi:ankyrin repeat protein
MDVVQLLLASGADVNAVDNSGQTSLHNVALGGNVKMLEFLLTNAPNATSTDLYNMKYALALLGTVRGGSPLETLIDALKNTNDGTTRAVVGKCKILYHFFKHWFFGK